MARWYVPIAVLHANDGIFDASGIVEADDVVEAINTGVNEAIRSAIEHLYVPTGIHLAFLPKLEED
jgi:hypothetical protein